MFAVCTDPVVAALIGATVGMLPIAGGLVGWRSMAWILRRFSRRARAAAIAGDVDQGIR